MDQAKREALARALANALLVLERNAAFDQVRVVFLEDEEAIPEISHDFGASGFDDLAFEPLYSRLLRGSDQQLSRLARRLGVSTDEELEAPGRSAPRYLSRAAA